MKQIAAWMILLAVLLPALALSEDGALYPIRERGLWGYMNRQGNVVIAPQWAYAGLFRDGLAVVGVDWHEGGYSEECALLRSDGTMVLTPPCMVIETRGGFRYCPWDEEQQQYGKMGFFDRESGFLLPPTYDSVWDFYGGELITVADWSEELNTHVYGFIRRDTGEVVFPLQYTCLVDGVGCSEGYVLAANEINFQDQNCWGPDYHLYTVDGEEIIFPEGVMPWSPVRNGVLILERFRTAEEEESHPSGWGQGYGLGSVDGTVIVKPEYDYIDYANEDGLYSIWLDGLCGVMDEEGNVIVPPAYDISTGGPPPVIVFNGNGFAVVDDQNTRHHILLDREGRELFSVPFGQTDEGTGEYRYFGILSPAENGCFWVYSYTVNKEERYRRENKRYTLMKVVDGRAVPVTDAVYEGVIPFIEGVEYEQLCEGFSEGLQAVQKNGAWGFIDENGAEILPFAWDAASNFYQGLALVEKDGKLCYIDRGGAVVWREE